MLHSFLIAERVLHARPSNLPWFDYPNNIWLVRIMKLLIAQFSPVTSPFLDPYSPQHPVLKHPEFVFYL
jgi:hypothetical protein